MGTFFSSNYFFGFNNTLSSNIDWFFNLNHLFLICFVALFVVVCCFLFSAKSEKGKKITKIALAVVLLILEIGRFVYEYLLHVHNGGTADTYNWWWGFSFQMCAIMTWTTIVTLILSAFLKKDNAFLQFLYNILFGCAMIGGILTFCYPDCLTANYPFFHFINIQTVVTHSLLIFVPIYLVKIKDFKVEIKNIWKVCAGYVYIGSVAMTASLISGNNFAYSLRFDLIDLGLPFPWHLPVIMLVMVAFASLIYGGFEIVRLVRRQRHNDVPAQGCAKQISNKNPLGVAIYVVSNVTAILFGGLIVLGVASLIGGPKSLAGLCCLIGLVYMILGLVFAHYIKHSVEENLDVDNKAKHWTLIALTLVFDLPVGVLYLIRYLKKDDVITNLNIQ